MNKLSTAKRVAVVAALVEGNSINSTVRMTNVSKPTILKLLAQLGDTCAKYQDATVRNVRARRVQVDEIWQFVYAKAKNVPAEKLNTFGFGDVWTWVALDADSKMVLSWRVGPRDGATAYDLMIDLAERITGRVQMTTDGPRAYLEAVEGAFGMDIDYATLQKVYGNDAQSEKRYSPAKILSSTTAVITGTPDPRHISTSYVERQNLTMRMSMRRFHPAHEWLLEEANEPFGRRGAPLHALQLRADSQDAARDASDASRAGVPRVEHRGNRWAARLSYNSRR